MGNLSFIAVFAAGILSFFSPCTIPLIPIYLSYLTTNTKSSENEKIKYDKKKIIIHTIFFVFGILSVYFILALGINILEPFINSYRNIILIVGGIIIILLGLNNLNLITINILKNHKNISFNFKKINFINAFILGFLFGCIWTPCTSAMLTAVITYSLTSLDLKGGLYIFLYGIGFSFPFIIISIFSSHILNFIAKKRSIFNDILKLSSLIMIVVGIMMFVHGINAFKQVSYIENNKTENVLVDKNKKEEEKKEEIKAKYFELYDQEDNLIKLTDYKDKFLMINFVTSWCKYCKQQSSLLDDYLANNKDVEVLVIMSDKHNNDGSDYKEYAKKYKNLKVINDKEGELFNYYKVYSYPQAYYIGPDQNVIGKLPGALFSVEDLKTITNRAIKLYQEKNK